VFRVQGLGHGLEWDIGRLWILDEPGYWTGLGLNRIRILGRLGYWKVIGICNGCFDDVKMGWI